jgi:broad specificity phosphatase PhoE
VSLTIVRHGDTEWSATGQHTGRTDLPLVDAGLAAAGALAARLVGRSFALVLTSPLVRARDTAVLAGFGDAVVDADLCEWDYGAYEGRTTAAIHEERPTWDLWHDGTPAGEQLADVVARCARVVARTREVAGDVLVFAHGHVLRVLTACWLGVDPTMGAHLLLDPATLSELGDDRGTPVIARWNS